MRNFRLYSKKDLLAFDEDLEAGVLNSHRANTAASFNSIVCGVKP
jgi:hypothetical protein